MDVGSVGDRGEQLSLRKTWVLASACVSDRESLRRGDFREQMLREMKEQVGEVRTTGRGERLR